MDLRPFSDKVCESLRLNSGAGGISDVVAHEFKSPLGNSSRGVAVVDDVSEWVRSDDRDFVVGEVV